MKKVILGFVVLLVVLIGVVVLAIANVNTYLDQNREQLATLIGENVGREVAFEKAEVAYQDGLAVRVAGLRISEDPRFGQKDFLALEDAYVGVKIWPALKRRIEVDGIALDQPTIRVIQTSRGFNFSSLGATGEADGATPAGDGDAAGTTEEAAPLAVAVAALEIDGGTIYYEDRTSADGLALVIEDFDTSGSNLTLDGPISFDFSGRIQSSKKEDAGLESRIRGDVALESLETAAGTVRLSSPKLHPALVGVRLEEGGAVEYLDDFAATIQLPVDAAKSGYPVEAHSSTARLSGFDLAKIDVDVLYKSTRKGSAVRLDEVVLGLAGGSVAIDGDVLLGEPGRSPFKLNTKVVGLESGEVAAVLLDVPRGFLSGKLGGDIVLQGDSLEWESLKRSLAGNLRLELGAGALENVNLLNDLVGKLIADPGIGALAAASLRDIAPKALQGDRTSFEGVSLALEILDGSVRAEDLILRAGDFAIKAAGILGLDGSVSADGTIQFSEALSQKLLAKADRLAPLLGDSKIVALPVHLGGSMDSMSFVPDLTALVSTATSNATAEVKEELTTRATEELSKVLFGKRKEAPAEGATDAAASPEASQKEANRNATEDLLRKGIGGLLGR